MILKSKSICGYIIHNFLRDFSNYAYSKKVNVS